VDDPPETKRKDHNQEREDNCPFRQQSLILWDRPERRRDTSSPSLSAHTVRKQPACGQRLESRRASDDLPVRTGLTKPKTYNTAALESAGRSDFGCR